MKDLVEIVTMWMYLYTSFVNYLETMHGIPEYGAGVLIFPDFLSIQAQVADDPLQEAYCQLASS